MIEWGIAIGVEIILFHIGKVIVGVALAKVTLHFGYLFVDDLTRVVNQIYSLLFDEGWLSQAPTTTPPPKNSGLDLIHGERIEGDDPAQDSEGKKLKMLHLGSERIVLVRSIGREGDHLISWVSSKN